VELARLPLTANGKLDRKALPAPAESDLDRAAYAAPRTQTETRLAELWQSVLKLPRVGVEDNFFALGGDSIVSIQLVSRAKQRGLYFSVRQLFEYPTIGSLSPHVTAEAGAVEAEQGAVAGELRMLPIQRRFFRRSLAVPDHYNQAVLLETPAGFDGGALRALVRALYVRHDALRLRFATESGAVVARHAPLAESMVSESVSEHALAPGPARGSDRAAQLTALCNGVQASLDIASGPLLRAAYVDLGGGEGRLLLVIHHLVVDGVSWRILLSDLEQGFTQLQRREAVTLGAKTSSLRQWGEALEAYARSPGLLAERAYWLERLSQPVPPPPRAGEGEGGGARSHRFGLAAEETALLLGECNQAYRTQVNELLLSALLRAYQRWSGSRTLCLQMEGHGREEVFEHLDTNETVGWFTSVYPLVLGESPEADLGTLIKSVKEQVRSVPNRGFGYGVLVELCDDEALREAGERLSASAIEFNYLGQFGGTGERRTAFTARAEDIGAPIASANRPSSALRVHGITHDDRLQITVTAETAIAGAGALAAAFQGSMREVIAMCVRQNKARKLMELPVDAHEEDETEESIEL
jgi:non-ribosomal peptide synthase protein (TIGR01720 family)